MRVISFFYLALIVGARLAGRYARRLLARNDVTFTPEDGQIENLHEAKLHNNGAKPKTQFLTFLRRERAQAARRGNIFTA